MPTDPVGSHHEAALPTARPPARRAWASSASAGLGGIGLLLSVVIVGVVPAVLGMALGMHARRRGSHASERAAAWTGIWLSTFGMVASLAFFAAYRAERHPLQFLMATVAQPAPVRDDPWKEWVGKAVPEVEWVDLNGARHRLSEWRGRRVILDLWATWCPPCVREIPHFQRLAQEFSAGDLAIVGITDEPASVVRPFAQAHGIRYAMGSASYPQWPEPFGRVAGLPTTFFIDRDGVLRSVALGYHSFEELKARAIDLDDASDRPVPAP